MAASQTANTRQPAILFLISRPLVEVRGDTGQVLDVDSLCDNNYNSEVEAICASLLHGRRLVHLIVRTATTKVDAELSGLDEYNILAVHFSGHGGRLSSGSKTLRNKARTALHGCFQSQAKDT